MSSDSDNFVKISKEIVKEYTEKQIEEFLKKLETEEASASLIRKTMSSLNKKLDKKQYSMYNNYTLKETNKT